MRVSLLVSLAAVLLGGQPAAAQSLSGPAEAIDGDTLQMTGMRIRLFAIDAPEGKQSCARDGTAWNCGDAARTQLAELIAGHDVQCLGHDTDQYGRLVATCRVGFTDLGETMVLSGLAVAYREFGVDYVEAEDRAKQFKLGMWAGTFEEPAQWRKAHPQARSRPARAAANAPASGRPAARTTRDSLGRCAIKGNRSRRGDWIYHLPGQPYYEETRPEALFCTEDEALRAGYRPSRAH